MLIERSQIKRVLVVRLRSIGDTVLATPSLRALTRYLPDADIDILVEDWVAPILDGFPDINVISIGRSTPHRLRTALALRKRKYDVAFNLHGGTTATMLIRASGASHRIGFSNYQYPFLYTDLLSSATDFWGRPETHSAEQQLALIGHVGVPVEDRPRSVLHPTIAATRSIEGQLDSLGLTERPFALMHPAAAFYTKRWPAENFARIAEHLADRGVATIAVAAQAEKSVLDELERSASVPIAVADDLTLPEITALASRADLFVGNDSGIAHIAAAVGTPTVVVFGSSNRDHWSPWTDAPHEVVFTPFDCQPCPGYECNEYGDAPCIRNVAVGSVSDAIDRILSLDQ